MIVFNKDKAVTILLYALFNSDKKACEEFRIHQKTLYNYKKRLREDSDFAIFFYNKKREYLNGFVDELFLACRDGAAFIRDVARNPPVGAKINPEFVHAMAGAIKICGEVAMTHMYIERKFKPLDEETAERSGLFNNGETISNLPN